MTNPTSPPQPAEGVAELVGELGAITGNARLSSAEKSAQCRALYLRSIPAALSASQRPLAVGDLSPSDEELLAAYRSGMEADMQEQYKYRDYASSAERRTMVAGLRAVAALTTPEGQK